METKTKHPRELLLEAMMRGLATFDRIEQRRRSVKEGRKRIVMSTKVLAGNESLRKLMIEILDSELRALDEIDALNQQTTRVLGALSEPISKLPTP